MAFLTKEYLRSIVPEDLPDGRMILQEGIEMGKKIEVEPSKFYKDTGFNSMEEVVQDSIDSGRVMISTNIGMATLKEQIEALAELSRWSKEIGINFRVPSCIPSFNLAIPKELREDAADSTSYMLDGYEDYLAHEKIDGITSSMANQVLFVPNALETTINCVKAGIKGVGTACELSWDFEGCDDHVAYVTDALRGLGILASKRKDGFAVAGYMEDGIGGNCADCVSFIGYMLFERYIYEDLCGVIYYGCSGGLLSNIRYKAALMKATDILCRTPDHHGVAMTHAATTIQWDHDIETNFGPSLQEILFMILAERHYKTGAAIFTVPITEAICVPTLDNIKSIMGASSRMIDYADQWEDLINWAPIDEIADVMVREGTKMYNNIMAALEEAGLDTKDPLQMLMVIKNINASLFEETFHPTAHETGKFTPYFPNDMGMMVADATNGKIQDLTAKGYTDSLKGKKVLVASLDGHVYGMRYVDNVLSAMGAEIVLGGVDNTPQSVLDLAEEEGIKYIGVSTHNGQSLGFANHLEKLMKQSGKEYGIFMGGILNTILPGHSEPSDVTDMIREKGIFASNDLEETIKMINKN